MDCIRRTCLLLLFVPAMAVAQENAASMYEDEFGGDEYYQSAEQVPDDLENRGQILQFESDNINRYGKRGRANRSEAASEVTVPMPGSINLDLKKEDDEPTYPETIVGTGLRSEGEEENENMDPTGPPPPPDPPDLPVNGAIHFLFLGGVLFGVYKCKKS